MKTGHFYSGKNRTFLNWFDRKWGAGDYNSNRSYFEKMLGCGLPEENARSPENVCCVKFKPSQIGKIAGDESLLLSDLFFGFL